MPLEITQREMNGIYLLALKGRLVLGQESSGRIDDGRDIFGFSSIAQIVKRDSNRGKRGFHRVWSPVPP